MTRRDGLILLVWLLSCALLVLVAAAQSSIQLTREWCALHDEMLRGDRVGFDNAAYAFIGVNEPWQPLEVLWVAYDPRDHRNSSAFVLYWLPESQRLLVFPFWNMVADGVPLGTHNFCTPRVYALGGGR